MAEHIAAFLSRITGLFGPDAKCLTQVGYTSFLFDTLKTPLVWVMRDSTCSLSSPLDADIAYALDRMRGWLKLAVAELKVESPCFEVAQALAVFNNPGTLDRNAPGWRVPFDRFATACDVDAGWFGFTVRGVLL